MAKKDTLTFIKDNIGLIKDMRMNGSTNDEVAEALGIARSTLQKYAAKDKDVADALDSKEHAIKAIKNKLFYLATGDDVPHAVQLKAGIDWIERNTRSMPNHKREALDLKYKEIEQKQREVDLLETNQVIRKLGGEPVD